MNNNNKCRLCLNYSDLQISLFGEYAIRNDILMKIKKCLPNKIVKNGNKISYICYKCLNSLDLTYMFWKQCHDTEVLITANNFAEQPTNRINLIDSDDDDDHFEFYSDPPGKSVQNNKVTATNIKPMEDANWVDSNGSPSQSKDYWQQINETTERKPFVKMIPGPQLQQSTATTSIAQIDTSEQASYSRLFHCFEKAYAIREKTPPPPPSISSSHQPQTQAHPEKQHQQPNIELIDSSLLSLTPQRDLIEKFRSWKPPPTPQTANK